ncbi:hypothetical protein [Sphingomonas sp. BK580]|uniref:hypothetical protein n=1 Tax=Sphingomonas sp. BK580 TaxID=2586972 RepID=UPI001622891C|nr:hypothetical protein [Sphingomonas sp. BK580]MBB3692456.1 hypothetical protein [Sphingomonas sp. BK580]
MTIVKTIASKDGKHLLDIGVSSLGLYRYTTFKEMYWPAPDLHDSPEWTPDEFSGLFETADEAEADARAKLDWLRE